MKKSKFIYILLAFGIILTACGNEDPSVKDEEKKETVKEVKTNYSFAKDSSLIVEVTNPVNEIVDIEVNVQYYNDQDEMISEVNATCISVHNFITAFTQFKDIPADATSIVVSAEYKETKIEESYSNILDVLTADNGHNVNVSVNNYNSYSIANTMVGVVYYDSNKIVAYNEYPLADITANETREFVANYPVDVNGNTIYFDTVSTVVNYAYNPVN